MTMPGKTSHVLRWVVDLATFAALIKGEQLSMFGGGSQRIVPVVGHMRVTHSGQTVTVAPHTRHVLSARDAFRLKANELRTHIEAGGDNAKVAQAELDRRAAKRKDGEAKTTAPAASVPDNTTAELTVQQLADTLWHDVAGGPDVRNLVPDNAVWSNERSRWEYKGSNLPVRKVDPDAKISVDLTTGRVTDSEGGWIADRFGKLGERQKTKVRDAMAAPVPQRYLENKALRSMLEEIETSGTAGASPHWPSIEGAKREGFLDYNLDPKTRRYRFSLTPPGRALLDGIRAADPPAADTAPAPEAIPGGPASGMAPADFDPGALARGTAEEKEHTTDPAIAQEIAMDHLAKDPAAYDEGIPSEGDEDIEPEGELVKPTPAVPTVEERRAKEAARLGEYLEDARHYWEVASTPTTREKMHERVKRLERKIRYLTTQTEWPPPPERGKQYGIAEYKDAVSVIEDNTALADLRVEAERWSLGMEDNPGFVFVFGGGGLGEMYGGSGHWTRFGGVRKVTDRIKDAVNTTWDALHKSAENGNAWMRPGYSGDEAYRDPKTPWRTPEALRKVLGHYIAPKVQGMTDFMRAWGDRDLYRKPQSPQELQARLKKMDSDFPYSVDDATAMRLMEWHGYSKAFERQGMGNRDPSPTDLIDRYGKATHDLAALVHAAQARDAAYRVDTEQREKRYVSSSKAITNVVSELGEDPSAGKIRHAIRKHFPGAKLTVRKFDTGAGPRAGLHEAVIEGLPGGEGWRFTGPKAKTNEGAVKNLVAYLAQVAARGGREGAQFWAVTDAARKHVGGEE